MSHTYAGHSKGEEGPYDPEFPEGEKSLDLEKLICPKCGEEFPATTDRGPGPAKAKFAAHVNKCEGKKQEEPLFSAVPGCLACSDVIPGDIIPATKDRKCLECGRDLGCADPSPQQVEALEEGAAALDKLAAEQPKNFKVKIISQNLKCVLTNAEFLSRAKEMSQANSEIIRLEAELKSVKSQYNSQIDKHTATRDDMSRRVSEGCEWRDVECREYWDYDRHEVYAVREDTFETVSQRTMTTAEMQRGLDFMERQETGAEG